jgi:preprotein translocase subunit SecE
MTIVECYSESLNELHGSLNLKTLEAKKPQPIASPKTDDSTSSSTGVIQFIGEVKVEMKKISWSTPEELQTYTKIVVMMTLLLGIGIYIVDLLIQGVLNGLAILAH